MLHDPIVRRRDKGEDSPTVCAVVLTYNRKDMLERCLTALTTQTIPCDRIVVVDNASSDGTDTVLATRWRDVVEVTTLKRNSGAAGGFNLGIRLAYASGADFVWVMDDDVFVRSDSLEMLLRGHAMLAERSILPSYLLSVARSTSGQLTEVPDIDRRRNILGNPRWAELLELGLVPTLGGTFASILFPRETLSRHGLPVASMFIFGEDREYTVRITREMPGYLVGASQVVHARKIEGVLDTRTETNQTRLGYHYFMHRNTTSTLRRYAPPGHLGLHLWRQFKLGLRLLLGGQLRRFSIVTSGTVAGLFYRPRIEAADAPFDESRLRDPLPAETTSTIANDANAPDRAASTA